MNIAVRGKSNAQQCHLSDISKGILNVISSFDDMLTQIPPIDQPQRFGNKAFKTWYERVQKVITTSLCLPKFVLKNIKIIPLLS